jgi:hypothetical protein
MIQAPRFGAQFGHSATSALIELDQIRRQIDLEP